MEGTPDLYPSRVNGQETLSPAWILLFTATLNQTSRIV